MSDYMSARKKITPANIAKLAAFFGVPETVFVEMNTKMGSTGRRWRREGRWRRVHSGPPPGGLLVPTAVVLHRTYGSWAGDFAVGKNGRSGQPIGFHFLVGKDGRAVQFYDTNTVCNHAKGANMWSIGVEFEGRNEGP